MGFRRKNRCGKLAFASVAAIFPSHMNISPSTRQKWKLGASCAGLVLTSTLCGTSATADPSDPPIDTPYNSETIATTKTNIMIGMKTIPASIKSRIQERDIRIVILPNPDTGPAGAIGGKWSGLSGAHFVWVRERVSGMSQVNNAGGIIKHELGHQLDFASGNPSQSNEFRSALAADSIHMTPSEISKHDVWDGSNKSNRELFANLVNLCCTPMIIWSNAQKDEARCMQQTLAFICDKFPELRELRQKEDEEKRVAQTMAAYLNKNPAALTQLQERADRELSSRQLQQAIADYSAVLLKRQENLAALHGRSQAYRGLGKTLASDADEECYYRLKMTNKGYKEVMVLPNADTEPQVWRYTDSPQSGAYWARADFDDRQWSQGKGAFGVYAPAAKIGTNWNNHELYLRRKFKLPATDLSNLKVRATHVNDMEVYFNGELAASAPGWTQTYKAIDILPSTRALLKPGAEIIIAVHCHNQNPKCACLDVGLYNYEEDVVTK
jgi:hypothetical protein